MNNRTLGNGRAFLRGLKTRPESYFRRRGEQMALTLFHEMAERVPAYADVLKKHRIRPESVRSAADIARLPLLSKDNYLRQYPRAALMWDGKLDGRQLTVSATSGSTGEPFYFPRGRDQDLDYARTAELYLLENFSIDRKSTLYIVGFPMGVWIGGVFTFRALTMLMDTGAYRLSVITPGISKQDIISAVQKIGAEFDQVIIGSYAPFLKDILDDAADLGLDWRAFSPGFVFSAEVFSETFRDYVIRKTGLPDPYLRTLNHYGTVDMGTMSHETPLSVFIRRRAVSDRKLYASVFSDSKLPTLTQYNPEQFYFEDIGGNLVCSARSGIPLIRYDLKDRGGVVGFSDMFRRLADAGLDLTREVQGTTVDGTVWHLPFVYVYERSDFSVSFFAFQIYPETVRKAVQDRQFDTLVTGKFTMQVTYDAVGNQQFHVHVEMRPHVRRSDELAGRIGQRIVSTLLAENSEFRKTHEMYGTRVYPEVVLWPYEEATHFKPGTKQKWVKK